MEVQRLIFKLAISAEQYLSVYKGHAKAISTLSIDGRRIEFSAEKVKPFLTRDGIYGVFEMQINEKHQFLSIKKLR
ncbi:MAG: topoisomerase II [Cycloclasticus sp. symbiont of Bathymodiolus heckerae]|nr:MAG: topoisomerase II [Cycloclasticus sp. symbiont of Bathymodiolus heckerae]